MVAFQESKLTSYIGHSPSQSATPPTGNAKFHQIGGTEYSVRHDRFWTPMRSDMIPPLANHSVVVKYAYKYPDRRNIPYVCHVKERAGTVEIREYCNLKWLLFGVGNSN